MGPLFPETPIWNPLVGILPSCGVRGVLLSRKEFGQRLGPYPPVSGAQIFWLDEVMHRLPAKRRNTIGALIIRIGFWGPVHLLVMLGDISFALRHLRHWKLSLSGLTLPPNPILYSTQAHARAYCFKVIAVKSSEVRNLRFGATGFQVQDEHSTLAPAALTESVHTRNRSKLWNLQTSPSQPNNG